MRSSISAVGKFFSSLGGLRRVNTALFGLALLLVGVAIGHTSVPQFVHDVWAAAISGGGTATKVAAFTASDKIGDSIIADDGTTVTIGTTSIPPNSMRMNVNGHFMVSGNPTSNADIKLNSVGRPSIYPWGPNVTGDMGLQIRSAGNGRLQFNNDNSGMVESLNGIILGNKTGAACNSTTKGMLASNRDTDGDLYYCHPSKGWQKINP